MGPGIRTLDFGLGLRLVRSKVIFWNVKPAHGVSGDVGEDKELQMKIHQGIRIDRIPVEGWLGVLWGSVIMVRTLVDVPDARWFFLASIPGGIAVAIALHYWRSRGT